MTVTFGSTFAGIGGFDLAFERAGMKPLWNCEIDDACRSVLKRHWPTVPQFGDIKEVTGDALRRAGLIPDVLCGGFPCQDLSTAGKRAGLAGERSGLFWEYARLLKEIRPRWFVLENVPGLLTSEGGRDFGTILETVAELGYLGAWRVLDAQYFGVAQRRRRVIFVGHLGDGARAARVLLESPRGHGHPAPSRTPRQASPGAAPGRPRGYGVTGGGTDDDVAGNLGSNVTGGMKIDLDSAGAYVVDTTHELAPTLQERDSKGNDSDATRPMVVYRKATKAHHPEDWERWEEAQAADALAAEGQTAAAMAVVTTVTGNEVSHTLTAEPRSGTREDGSGRGTPPVVAYSIYPETGQGTDIRATETDVAPAIASTDGARQTDRGLRVVAAWPVDSRNQGYEPEGSPVPTLPATDGGGDHRTVAVQYDGSEPYTFDWQAGGHGDTSFQGKSRIYPVRKPGVAGSLQANKVEAVAYADGSEPEPYQCQGTNVGPMGTLRAGNGDVTGGVPFMPQGMAVRRLTPVECERLQGFPDGWTDGQVKTVRYRQLGNAVAVPVFEWIARRIVASEEGRL